MNIVLFISAMQDGGAESVAATLVNAWVERSDSVTLVATYSGRSTCNYPVSSRVKFVYLADLVTRRGRGPLAFVERMSALRALMRESQADVIVSFQLPNGGWSKNLDMRQPARVPGESYATNNLSKYPDPAVTLGIGLIDKDRIALIMAMPSLQTLLAVTADDFISASAIQQPITILALW